MTDSLELLQEDGTYAIQQIPLEILHGKRVLVTGASGLIGTHFIAGLIEKQRQIPLEIVGLVRSSIPQHLAELCRNAEVCIMQGDLSDRAIASTLPEADIILHAATYGQPGLFAAEPTTTLRLNTEGTFSLFDRLRPNGKFLFISTSELYSGLSKPPFSEDQIGTTNTTHPRSCYIESKRAGESIILAYRSRGVDAKAVRLALAYGPGTRAGDRRVLNSFIERALTEGEIRLLDLGLARRTYCYVRDAVKMMWHITLQGRLPLYNVGGASSTTIANLAQCIGNKLSVPVILPKSNNSAMTGAPDDVRVDLGRYIREFGQPAFTDLEEGLHRTIRWQRDTIYSHATSGSHSITCPR